MTGFGFAAMGGGTLAAELAGLEPAGVLFSEDAAGFFQGAADPFPPPIPGNTAIGLAEASAATEEGVTLGTFDAGRGLAGGGGGGGAAAAGTGSR